MLVEKIGEPAALELLAEECTELAQAALKLARKERREIARIIDQSKPFMIKRTRRFNQKLNEADKQRGAKILLIHNHPRSMPPSYSDINALYQNKNVSGITIGHNGNMYYYTRPNKIIQEMDFSIAIRNYPMYSEITAIEKALADLSVEFGFTIQRLR